MLYLKEHNFIFIHIGKTGGTSMEKVLCSHFGIAFRETTHGHLSWNPKQNHVKHIWARGMIKKVGMEAWRQCFTFAFVRNPYDMVVSLYSMFTQYEQYIDKEKHPDLFHPWNQYENFEDFLLKVDQGKCIYNKAHRWNNLKNLQTKYLTRSMLWRWQRREILVDFVGRYETLQDDFNKVCDRIGIPPLALIRHGGTNHKHYDEMYTPKTRRIVERHFKLDLKMFDYDLV